MIFKQHLQRKKKDNLNIKKLRFISSEKGKKFKFLLKKAS